MRIRLCILAALLAAASLAAPKFTIEQVMSYAFPSDLTASAKDGKIAWALDERGPRNLWVAEAPDYRGKRLTHFQADDGQEIDQIEWLPDAKSLVYVRGGDFETHRDNPNPSSSPDAVEQAIWWISLSGDAPKKIAEGNSPAVSPKGDRIVYLKANQIWEAPLDGSTKPAQLIHAKGQAGAPHWSPDGTRIVFVSNRGDHTLIGLYDFGAKSLSYLDPSTDRDQDPVWSPDGRQVAYIRIASMTRAFMFGPVRSADTPWSIRLADTSTGKGRQLWQASPGPGSAFHPIVAENQLFWGAGNRVVFPWEKTGWVHLYSISVSGDTPTALNPSGQFEVEHVSLTRDGHDLLFSTNQDDIDRRHIRRVSVLGEKAASVTSGDGLEWSPVELSDGHGIAVLHSDWKTPAQAGVVIDGKIRNPEPEDVMPGFPSASLVKPQPVMISAADGMQIHGQLFLPPDLKAGEKRPAMIFFHGGSRRQMLLGFHYMGYYHNAYAMNQYLASLGYIVLAVNYRSGIGYGLDFREALNYGATGASEFNDVVGAGLFLRNRPDVDSQRIGLWGGSYGGYLTALGLARASDLFAVGVDFHGVHDWNNVIRNFVNAYDPNKDPKAAELAFDSSPLASVKTWRSPVLLIHGDDDRNVPFGETVRLVEALRKQKVQFEELIFPDEIHGFLTHKRWVEAYTASAEFMDKHLKR